MNTTVSIEQSFAFAKVDTGTMSDLVCASWKLSNKANGKIWSYIDASVAYLQTSLNSTARLTNHATLALFALLTIWSESGRRFCKENLHRSIIDISGILIGALGAIYPYGAQSATAREILFLNAHVLDYRIFTKKELENYKYANSIVISNSFHEFVRTSFDQAKEGYTDLELITPLKPAIQ